MGRSSFLRRRAEARIKSAFDNGGLELSREKELHETSAAGQQTLEQKPARPAQHNVGAWRNLVEQRIQEGIEQGLFENLAGAGKPLNLDEDAFVPEDMRMAFRLLRSNGLAPLWVQLNKEIRDDIERLYRFRAHVHATWERSNPIQREHHRKDYIGRIGEINDKILNYNILAPSPQVHFVHLILDDELTKFDAIEERS